MTKTATERVDRRKGRTEDAGRGSGAGGRRGWPPWAVALGLAGLHVVLALLVFDPTPHTGGDNGSYLSLARSLLERGAYVDLYDPTHPAHTQYPPVFPGILAAGLLLGLKPWVGFKLLIVGFSAAGVALSYLWLRRWRSGAFALGTALLVALSPGVLHLSHWILSDIPFWTFTMLALWAFERAEPDDRTLFGVAVAAVVLAYFTRSAGLPLLLAAGGWLALRRQWKRLGAFAVAVLPLAVLWWLRSRAHGGVDYVQQFLAVNPYVPALGTIDFGGLVERVLDNNRRYFSRHLPRLLVGREGPMILPLSILVGGLAVVGWARRVRSRPGVTELFLPLYVGLLFAWPSVWAGDRFLLPAFPLILAYAGEVVVDVAGWVRSGAARPVGIAAVALLALAGAPALQAHVRHGTDCTAAYLSGMRYPCLAGPWRDFFALADWTRGNLPEDAAVISRKPRLFYALSGVPGQIYPKSPEPEEFFALARTMGARYVILDRLDAMWQMYLAPVLTARPDAFCIVTSLGADRVTLFGIRPEALEDAAAQAPPAQGALRFATCPDDYLAVPAGR